MKYFNQKIIITIERFQFTWRHRRHVNDTWTKDFSLASIVRDTNMAAMSLSFYSLGDVLSSSLCDSEFLAMSRLGIYLRHNRHLSTEAEMFCSQIKHSWSCRTLKKLSIEIPRLLLFFSSSAVQYIRFDHYSDVYNY
jgi:hypothetical protein